MFFFFFQAEDGIRDKLVTGVQTCALPIWVPNVSWPCAGRSSLLELAVWARGNRRRNVISAGRARKGPTPGAGPWYNERWRAGSREQGRGSGGVGTLDGGQGRRAHGR